VHITKDLNKARNSFWGVAQY